MIKERENQSIYSCIVEVKDGILHKTYRYRDTLKKFGLSYTEKGYKWTVEIPNDERGKRRKEEIKQFCKVHRLNFMWKSTEYARDTKYRKRFFEEREPVVGKFYVCMYCGKLIKRDEVQVDHIIPVFRAETDWKVQMLIKNLGWKGVNDVKNLGASCGGCNRKKSSKMGWWLIRGILGKFFLFQCIRWGMRIAFLIVLLAVSFHLFMM